MNTHSTDAHRPDQTRRRRRSDRDVYADDEPLGKADDRSRGRELPEQQHGGNTAVPGDNTVQRPTGADRARADRDEEEEPDRLVAEDSQIGGDNERAKRR